MKKHPDFLLAGNLSLNNRMALIAILGIAGIIIQLVLSVPLGWLFILGVVFLSLLDTRSNEPDYSGGGEWQNTTLDEMQDALLLITRSRQLNENYGSFSLSTASGCGMAFVTVAGIAFVTYILYAAIDKNTAVITLFSPVLRGGLVAAVFALDAVTLLAPMWMSGRIKAWQPPFMQLRLEQLMYIYNKGSNDPRLEFQPSLQVVKTKKGMVPLDCKLMVKFKDAAPEFIGIQVQTSLNDVQGTKYPYTYCVLIAKPEFDLLTKCSKIIELPPEGGFSTGFLGIIGGDANDKKEAEFARFEGNIVELNKEKDVEIAVVRQRTGGNGYKTSDEQAMAVFTAAELLAAGVLSKA